MKAPTPKLHHHRPDPASRQARVLAALGTALLVGTLAWLPTSAVAQAAAASPATRQAIEGTNGQFLDALGRGDAAGCAAAYAENGRVFPAGSPMVIGRRAIQTFWQGAIDAGAKAATLTILELEELGDTAIEIGTYTLDVRPPSGPPAKDEGKYVVIWKRQSDGTWKLAVDIFNTSLPPAK